jgi:hypothetical protein
LRRARGERAGLSEGEMEYKHSAVSPSSSASSAWGDSTRVMKTGTFSPEGVSSASLESITFDEAPALVLGFVSPRLDFDEVVAKVKASFPAGTRMILTSTAGELCNSSADQGAPYCVDDDESCGIVLQSFSGRLIEASYTVSVKLGNEDIREGRPVKTPAQRVRAIADQLSAVNLPFAVDHKDTFAYALVDGLSNSESFFMEAVYESGAFPCLLVGGSAGGKLDFKDTYIYDGAAKRQGYAVVTVIKVAAPYRFGILKSQNFEKTDKSFVILGCDPTLRTVTDTLIEDRMERMGFVDALCKAIGCDFKSLESKLSDYSFGVEIGGEMYVRSIASIDASSKVVKFYCDIDLGDRLWLLKRTDFLATTNRHFAEYSAGKPKAIGGILNDCILRRLFNSSSLPALAAFKGIPLAGFSTFGELLGVNINQTLTAIFFHDATGREGFEDPYVDSFLAKYTGFSSYFLKRRLAQGDIIKGLYGKVLSRIFESAPIVKGLTEAYADALGEVRRYLAYLKQLTEKLASMSSTIDTSSADNSRTYSQVKELAVNMNQINTIATTVADIAEQTNVLSINATIQAVRAGEHGRAFAVVASEVRKLSMATQENVKMINSTAKSIFGSVEGIRTKMDSASEHLQQMVSSNSGIISETDRIIKEITSAKEDMERKFESSEKLVSYLKELEHSQAMIHSLLESR